MAFAIGFDISDFAQKGLGFYKALGPRTDYWLDKAGRESIDRMSDGRYWTQRSGMMNRSLRLDAPSEYRRRVVASAKHAGMLQFGTKPHVIRPKRKGGLLRFISSGGSLVLTRKVNHPGTRGFFYVEKESDWMSAMLPRVAVFARDEALSISGFG